MIHANAQASYSQTMDKANHLDTVREYHQLSKHSFEAYAKGPETLDWDAQPNPFRSFSESETIPLSVHSQLQVNPDVDLPALSSFLRLSLGVTAWKQYGPDKWSLRVNPSSGNLHPTEAYILLPQGKDQLDSGLYHYNSENHILEKRADCSGIKMPDNSFMLIFSSVLWRELWKYGERGFRYTQLDIGHAMSAVSSSAKAHGWDSLLLPELDSTMISEILGLQRSEYQKVEKEIPECALLVGKGIVNNDSTISDIKDITLSNWQGAPTRLGERSFYKWPWAEKVAIASESSKHSIKVHSDNSPKPLAYSSLATSIDDYQAIALKRRSAQAFDKSSISIDEFNRFITTLLTAEQSLFPADITPMNFVIMVHRVEGLTPGIYILLSHDNQLQALKSACSKWPDWTPVETKGLESSTLYQLSESNVQKATRTLCCQQAIAADGAFTLGFIANYDNLLKVIGAEAYRQMYWQAGILSQKLYMEATHMGLSATGIGCFFDDPWAGVLGIESTEQQIIYATAIGKAVIDNRITSLSGYYHLAERSE